MRHKSAKPQSIGLLVILILLGGAVLFLTRSGGISGAVSAEQGEGVIPLDRDDVIDTISDQRFVSTGNAVVSQSGSGSEIWNVQGVVRQIQVDDLGNVIVTFHTGQQSIYELGNPNSRPTTVTDSRGNTYGVGAAQ